MTIQVNTDNPEAPQQITRIIPLACGQPVDTSAMGVSP
jgi:hypothetical protein